MRNIMRQNSLYYCTCEWRIPFGSQHPDMLTSGPPAAALTVEGLRLFREGHSVKDGPVVLGGVVPDVTRIPDVTESSGGDTDRSGTSGKKE
ncbi:hypothetical protein F2P81_008324 [Scophthalmus maximus]|uniref:Uncharacterized protein n=1 Tax=Scophthalmus maximus TaxID=52904 RepID=A0A6A4T590_SCOMX|nr:hypothetical protein F2P81_008324 [Scophthalmus maximus]